MNFPLGVLIVFTLVCISGVSAELDESTLKNISSIPLAVPATGSAPLGSQESMDEYQYWLEDCSYSLVNYANSVIGVLGFPAMNWKADHPRPVRSPVNPQPVTVVATPVIQPAIPASPGLIPIANFTGGSGHTTFNMTIPDGYWELWYTADPLVMGAQDSHSAQGINSAVFPMLSIKITDAKTGEEIETVQPPGGLDSMLWARAGDPRPWSKKFYRGNREFTFDVTSRFVRSYTIEPRIRFVPPRVRA